MPTEFKNEMVLDFSQDPNRTKQAEALAQVQSQLGREYDLIIGGEPIKSNKTFKSINPSRKSEVVGIFQSATQEQAVQAIEAASRAFEKWKRVPARERAEVLFQTADLLRTRRFESNAWMVLETGKTWIEADADTAEAIDFCEFYAREALRYAGPQPITHLAGEDNDLRYIPLGAGAVIPAVQMVYVLWYCRRMDARGAPE